MEDEVRVWRVELTASADRVRQFAQILSRDELERAERFYLQKHRDRFIMGRGMLRTILGQYLDAPPDRLQFKYGSHGKPSLLPTPDGRTAQFNMAHSEDLALVAIASAPVGIDIERIRLMPEAERLVQRFFAASEHAFLCSLPPSERQTAFFRYWTCKEAYLKAIGSGLAHGLDQVAIDLAGDSARLHSINGSPQSTQSWSLWELHPAQDYAAACIVEGRDRHLNCWQWQESDEK